MHIIDDLRRTDSPGMRQHEREARVELGGLLTRAADTIEELLAALQDASTLRAYAGDYLPIGDAKAILAKAHAALEKHKR